MLEDFMPGTRWAVCVVAIVVDSNSVVTVIETQIRFGNDKQKGKSKRRFPAGMTNRRARASADSLRE
jgi:hypothetical protein